MDVAPPLLAARMAARCAGEVGHLDFTCLQPVRAHGAFQAHLLAVQRVAIVAARQRRAVDRVPANAQGSGFCQTQVQDCIALSYLSQHLDMDGESPFLAERRCLYHVENTGKLTQLFKTDGKIFRRLIIHFELAYHDAAIGVVRALDIEYIDQTHIAQSRKSFAAESITASQQ